MDNVIKKYINDIYNTHSTHNATEHTYRLFLKSFLENIQSCIIAINEPKRVLCGAPDYVVQHKGLTIGYIEAKDIGISLDEMESSEQLARYRRSLSNLILTDYLEFRWYVDGEKRASARAAYIRNGKLHQDSEGAEKVLRILLDFLAHAPWSSPRLDRTPCPS